MLLELLAPVSCLAVQVLLEELIVVRHRRSSARSLCNPDPQPTCRRDPRHYGLVLHLPADDAACRVSESCWRVEAKQNKAFFVVDVSEYFLGVRG